MRSAYQAAHRAVRNELARLNAPVVGATPAKGHAATPAHGDGNGNGNGHLDRGVTPAPLPRAKAGTGRLATPGQVKAIRAIARRAGLDLRGLLGDYRAEGPEDLGMRQASELIDRLKATVES